MSTEKLRLKIKNLKREISVLHQKVKWQSQTLKKREEEIAELKLKLEEKK